SIVRRLLHSTNKATASNMSVRARRRLPGKVAVLRPSQKLQCSVPRARMGAICGYEWPTPRFIIAALAICPVVVSPIDLRLAPHLLHRLFYKATVPLFT